MSLQPSKPFFVYKNHLDFFFFFFPSNKWEQTGSEPINSEDPDLWKELQVLLIALSVHSLCYLNHIPKAPQLGSLVVVFSTDFELWPAPVSCFNRFSCVTGIFIFSSRYKSRMAMLVMSEGSLGRNMHIYQIFTSEETWMLIICIIAKVAAQVVR